MNAELFMQWAFWPDMAPAPLYISSDCGIAASINSLIYSSLFADNCM